MVNNAFHWLMDPKGCSLMAVIFRKKKTSCINSSKSEMDLHHCRAIPQRPSLNSDIPQHTSHSGQLYHVHQTGLWAMPSLRGTKPTVNTIPKNEMSLQNKASTLLGSCRCRGRGTTPSGPIWSICSQSIEGLMGTLQSTAILNRCWLTNGPLSTVHTQLNSSLDHTAP